SDRRWRAQLGNILSNFQTCPYGTRSRILKRLGPAKVDHQPVAEVLCYMSLIACDDFTASALICLQHVTQLLWVELFGKGGGADQIAEHDSDLASLRIDRWLADRRGRHSGVGGCIEVRAAAGAEVRSPTDLRPTA